MFGGGGEGWREWRGVSGVVRGEGTTFTPCRYLEIACSLQLIPKVNSYHWSMVSNSTKKSFRNIICDHTRWSMKMWRQWNAGFERLTLTKGGGKCQRPCHLPPSHSFSLLSWKSLSPCLPVFITEKGSLFPVSFVTTCKWNIRGGSRVVCFYGCRISIIRGREWSSGRRFLVFIALN